MIKCTASQNWCLYLSWSSNLSYPAGSQFYSSQTWPTVNRTTLKFFCFFKNIRTMNFLWTEFWRKVCFVTQPSSNACVSVSWIVWVYDKSPFQGRYGYVLYFILHVSASVGHRRVCLNTKKKHSRKKDRCNHVTVMLSPSALLCSGIPDVGQKMPKHVV